MKRRRTASGAALVVLTGALVAASAPAHGDAIRTDTTLGGFSIKTTAAPLRIYLDDPTLAIPHEPGTPVLEADASYTDSTLETGPAARGLASTLWPGSLFGDGVGTVTNGQISSYPIKADARYPDKPYTATANGCLQPGTCFGDNGALMQSQALGLDVAARARLNPADLPGVVDVGSVASNTTATVKDGVAIGTAHSAVTDLKLLTGIIDVTSVSTDLSVKGDGRKATSAGSTTVTGLTIAGVGYVLDDQGLRPVGTPVNQGTGPLPTNGLDPLKALGISVSGITQTHADDATNAARDASGLRITVDTVVLRGVLNQLPSQVWDALYSIVNKAPAQAQGTLYYLLGATPKITFLLGAGSGAASATLPLSFTFPDLPGLPVGAPPAAVTAGAAPSVPGAPVMAIAPAPVTGGAPVVSGPAATSPVVPTLTTAAQKDSFGGLSPGLLLLVLALAGAGGWGLLRVQSLAFLAGAAAGPCTDGTSATLPDLRGA